MTTTLLIIQFVLALIITITVLLQKSASMGLGAYSGSNDSLFGAKGPTSFLAKATFTLGFLFIVNTLALGYFYNQNTLSSAVDSVDTKTLIPQAVEIPQATTAPSAPVTDAPATPVAPVAPEAPVVPTAPVN